MFKLHVGTLWVLLILLALGGCQSHSDSTNPDGDRTDGDAKESDIIDGDAADDDVTDRDEIDGDETDRDFIDGDGTDDDVADGDLSGGDVTDGGDGDGYLHCTEGYHRSGDACVPDVQCSLPCTGGSYCNLDVGECQCRDRYTMVWGYCIRCGNETTCQNYCIDDTPIPEDAPEAIWAKQEFPENLSANGQDRDGNIGLQFDAIHGTDGKYYSLAIMLNADGSERWRRKIDTPSYGQGNPIMAMSQIGHIALAYECLNYFNLPWTGLHVTCNPNDIVLVVFDKEGNLKVFKKFNSLTQYTGVIAIAVGQDGSITIAGYSNTYIDFSMGDPDAQPPDGDIEFESSEGFPMPDSDYGDFLVHFDALGELSWVRWDKQYEFGASRWVSIHVDTQNDILAYGWSTTSMVFGDITLENPNGQIDFLAKFAPNGEVKWARNAAAPGDSRATRTTKYVKPMPHDRWLLVESYPSTQDPKLLPCSGQSIHEDSAAYVLNSDGQPAQMACLRNILPTGSRLFPLPDGGFAFMKAWVKYAPDQYDCPERLMLHRLNADFTLDWEKIVSFGFDARGYSLVATDKQWVVLGKYHYMVQFGDIKLEVLPYSEGYRWFTAAFDVSALSDNSDGDMDYDNDLDKDLDNDTDSDKENDLESENETDTD